MGCFDSNIERHVEDDSMKLNYLIKLCLEKAKTVWLSDHEFWRKLRKGERYSSEGKTSSHYSALSGARANYQTRFWTQLPRPHRHLDNRVCIATTLYGQSLIEPAVSLMTSHGEAKVFLGIVPVKVHGRNRTVETYTLLDDCFNISLW